MSIEFPNVPKAPGVPPVHRGPDNAGGEAEAPLSSDSDAVTAIASTQWGVYTQGGARALEPDNIVGLEYSAEYRLADFPIEAGQLETYDKVRLPFSTRVVMTKGGPLAERRAFAKKLEALRGDLEFYNVVTPDAAYLNVNIDRLGMTRTAQTGATLLTVEVGLREIRQTVNTKTSSSQDAASAAPVNNGSAQTKTASSIASAGSIQ